MVTSQTFQCPVCGLHYADKTLAKQCEAFCKEQNGCSLEITKFSIERMKAVDNSAQNL